MNYIGMDIHKQFTVVVVKDEQGNKLAEDKFDNDEWNFRKFFMDYPVKETKIVMESTCVWEYIYEIIEEMSYEVKLANPSRTRAIAEARKKTDIIDAETLADLLRANLIVESYIPPREIRRLREITRLRKVAVKQKNQAENRLHALLTRKGIFLPKKTLCKKSIEFLHNNKQEPSIVEYLELVEFHRERLGVIENKIKDIAFKENDAILLMTAPGIGPIHAMEILAEIGDIKRFPTANRLCSYAGLVPSIKQSGSSLRFGRLMQQASKTLKHALIQSAWVTTRTKESNSLQEFYKKLAKKKGKQKAICATARKLCCVIHAMLRKQEEFSYS